ncbi:hypothetical protein MNAN1_001998 [Malassezia nana]|uniref:Amine oxidase domain-containing protein n=1 Tax=Malassezia nana TaxID=180528 RepID=A0AAF0EJR7_9BASI|nr:hypothetical protein MNAN1_001998 [Malassezia nana]
MMHGIYAGDSRELSVKSILPSLVHLEQNHGGLLRALLPKSINSRFHDRTSDYQKETAQKLADIKSRLRPDLLEQLQKTSIYSFPNGLGELISSLEDRLSALPHVDIWKGAACESIRFENNFFIETRYATEPLEADRIVATMPSQHLAPLIPDLPYLSHNPAAHLGVVDVILASPNDEKYSLPIRGFGYLVPRNTSENHDEILGTVLDSDAIPNQGTTRPDGSSSFYKLTVMMGGPYWRHRSSFPSEDEVKERAMRALHVQLGIPARVLDRDTRFVHAHILTNTIPQYLVGHQYRMKKLHDMLHQDPRWRNRVSLLGYSYGGVGVNDCIATAMDTCEAIAQQELCQHSERVAQQSTGLYDIAHSV